MPSPSVTYTFSNSTTADATQVNQNFTDIINGITDGTKDLSVSALTCAGTATLNGNVALGNSSSDDFTITASLASTLPIKTTFSYDFGSSTIGLRDLFFGSADSAARTTKIRAGTVASSNTVTLPTDTGTLALVTGFQPAFVENLGLAFSVGASALTIALKQANGSTDPAAGTGAVKVAFRSGTAGSALYNVASITGALSVVVPSGATLGWASGSTCYGYIYLQYNSGTPELVVSSAWLDEQSLQTSTSIGTGSDDNGIYATTGRASQPIRMIGRFLYTTAPNGTYSAVPDEGALITNPAAALIRSYAEVKSSSGVAFAASTQYKDLNSLVVQPGEYELSLFGIQSATASITDFRYGISTTTGNSTTGLTTGDNWFFDTPGTSSFNKTFLIPNYRVTPTATTTYYAKISVTFGGSTPNVDAHKFSARRIK